MVSRQFSQSALPPHRHEFFEIVVILSGQGVHVTGSFRRKIQAGDVFVINRRRAHGYEETRRLNLANILIRGDVMQKIGAELRSRPGYHALFNPKIRRWRQDDPANRIRLSSQELERVSEWVVRIEEETTHGQPWGRLLAQSYLTLIIDLIVRKQGETRRAVGVGEGDVSSMGKVLAWVEKNLHKPLRVSELAQAGGMSERSLYREFHRFLGRKPAEYVWICRMERAAVLLGKASDRTRISEIAQRCGYEDSNYFSTSFRKFHECSPREFRARQRGELRLALSRLIDGVDTLTAMQ